ncbi:MAG TPA: carboxypeptidase-like regulatory domain-containing protein [Terracidiphilus sp.]
MNYGRWPLPLRSYFAVLLLVLTAQFASAQYTTGTIQGSVLDASGAAVKSAHITLRNTETNQTKQFTTGDDGVYLFAAVPPGAYELTAEANGFSKEILKFAASSNDRLTENLVLKVASGNTTVVVQAGNATEFHTTDAQLDTTRVAEEVDGLQLQSRTVTSLVTLEPGVQPMYTAGRGSLVKVAGAQTGLFTANGGRPESSNIEIDSDRCKRLGVRRNRGRGGTRSGLCSRV